MSWAVWITGLPGSGKSAIAGAATADLQARGEQVMLLELDQIRKDITPQPTYSDAEREAVYRALVYIAAALADAGVAVIIDATGHRRAWRELARATIPNFAEVQLYCPLEICRERERARPAGAAPVGIYDQSVRPGATVPGVNVEYEYARAPEVAIDTTAKSVAEAAADVVAMVRRILRTARQGPPASRSLGDLELSRRVQLAEDDDMQKAIARRAFVYAGEAPERRGGSRRRRRCVVCGCSRADGESTDHRPRRAGSRRAQRHAAGSARGLRAAPSGPPRLRRSAASHRRRADDLPAVYRGHDDGVGAPAAGRSRAGDRDWFRVRRRRSRRDRRRGVHGRAPGDACRVGPAPTGRAPLHECPRAA